MTAIQPSPRIGFLGTGNIGQPIIRNLLASGYPVTVWNRTPARYADLLAAGATASATPHDLAAASDIVIAMLMEPAHLDALLDGADGVLGGIRAGSIFIDLATSPPRHAQQLERQFAGKSVSALDIPVQGGVKAALDGSLTMMAGGDRAAFDRVLPVLEAVGKTIVYVGAAGSGQITKLCHQIVCAVTLEAVAESFALAKSFGTDQTAMRDVLLTGLSASPVLKNASPKMIAGNFTAGRPLWMYEKDRTHLAETLAGTDLELPIATAVFERMYGLIANGGSDLDESALITLLTP